MRIYQLNTQVVPLTKKAGPISARDMEKVKEKMSEKSLAWVNFTVREMIGLEQFRPDPDWIAARLYPAMTREQARISLESLKKAKFIEFDLGSNKYNVPDPNIRTGDEAPVSVKEFHKAMFAVLKEILEIAPEEECEIGAMTIWVGEDTVKAIKKEISNFLDTLMENDQEFGTADRIYQFNVQLYPHTKIPT